MRVAQRLPLTVALALSAVVLSCTDGTAPADPNLTGTWAGAAAGRTISLNLTDTDGSIGGSGTITSPAGTITTNGSRSGREVSLNATVALGGGTFSSLLITGQIDSDEVIGTISGSGYSSEPITLVRNP